MKTQVEDWEQVMRESYALGCRRLQFIGEEPFCIGVDNLLVLIQKAHYGHNCFSEKICVTASGDILPCIMERNIVLGNILEKSLEEIIYSEESKELRNITKDKIEVCRDCEYRYCCFDCRIKAKNFYDKPSDCLYDPYTGKWAKFEKEILIK
ncbi:MAG: SPASM domain-containing protein [Candidatus Pacebacteria bacterium]|nr:SPASM domain-containing protein [Candidatus Paceibacterota bacterium]